MTAPNLPALDALIAAVEAGDDPNLVLSCFNDVGIILKVDHVLVVTEPGRAWLLAILKAYRAQVE